MLNKNPWETIKISQISNPTTITHMSQDAQLIYILSGEASISGTNFSMTFGVGEFLVVPNFSKVFLEFETGKCRVYLMTFTYFGSENENSMEVFRGDSKSRGKQRIRFYQHLYNRFYDSIISIMIKHRIGK